MLNGTRSNSDCKSAYLTLPFSISSEFTEKPLSDLNEELELLGDLTEDLACNFTWELASDLTKELASDLTEELACNLTGDLSSDLSFDTYSVGNG